VLNWPLELYPVDRKTRKNIKTDKFAEEVGHTFEFLTSHTAETKRYVAIGLAVLLVAGGIYYYVRHQAGVREEALAAFIKIDNASISTTPQPPNLNFATQEEKDKARSKALNDLKTKYHGTQEGSIAGMFLAADEVDKSNYAQAEKLYRDVMDSAPSEYSSLARVSLAQVLAAQGKTAEAEKLMNNLIDHPTAMVSKEQATLQLAQILIPTDPAKARKLLQPLTTARTAISKAAIDEMGKVPQTN
jgi:predicted negative regulator of RcsB-dependent stress response